MILIIPSLAFPYKKVKCFVLKPPEQVLEGVQRIAVMDFSTEGSSAGDTPDNTEEIALKILSKVVDKQLGDDDDDNEITIQYGKSFSGSLISALIEPDRGIEKIKTGFLGMGKGKEGKTLQEGTFTNVFEIVERDRLMQVLKEQELSMSGLINENQAMEIGNMLGVQAVIMGDVNFFFQDDEYKEKRTVKKNKKKTTKMVDCTRRKVNVTVKARIISAETGQVLGSTEAKESLEKSQCEDRYGSLPSVDEMINTCLDKSVPKIANYISPYYELESFELKKIEVKKHKKNGEKAAKLAEKLKINKAYLIYKAIYDKDMYNPEVMYNLGVMNEVVGNFNDAAEFYQMAQQLKDDGRFRDAMKRTEKNVLFADALSKMGVEIVEHQFVVTEAATAAAMAGKVKTKGSRDDRIPVYKEADGSSEVVARVPGDLSFTVVRRINDWYLIKLLGGKEGYIHKDKVEQQ